MKFIKGNRVPIKSWCNNPEHGAIEQALNLSKLPFVFKHVALMPDTHQGYGMPIGGVIACENAVIPNAVGVDIGCGMCSVRTDLKVDKIKDSLKEIMGLIRETIPLGKNHNKESNAKLMPAFHPNKKAEVSYPVVMREYESACYQLGSLGGGNHFIEIQKDADDNVWIMIHSGSRNLGYKVAKYYNELAYNICKGYHSETFLPNNKEDSLAFFPLHTKDAEMYLSEMNYCLEFALINRKIMMNKVIACINGVVGKGWTVTADVNIHHNYATMENHYGKNVMVHRKGATSAKEHEIGIIPGSQGVASYIVRGKGNCESFMSCSHGAGRKMSRNDAKKNLNLEEEQKKLDDLGIVHTVRHTSDLDESPSAYKDINVVMEEQKDLVDILCELKPLACVKG